MAPKYPNVKVQLTGQNGNAFNIIGRVTRELRRANACERQSKIAKKYPTTDSTTVAIASGTG